MALPCYRTNYKVNLLREMSEIEPNKTIVYIILNQELKVETMINNYTIVQFLADAGGAMGKFNIINNHQ